ncbi:leucyl aminopeptidase [Allorhodopirellula heiligendammensis]|uniref:Probable cytosol aminopeptidase n=1 Tax=Allorhodopirellula heiligendammensis TaxID=2714739 RepID=A0A5C6BYQ6_9BACT|nr:leucyl aminopeptidase [Allorhodopirellula heiligendammensis]TWU16014.1 Cytosol aminopeptidase [Allorhodopirellula heiligendammensis]
MAAPLPLPNPTITALSELPATPGVLAIFVSQSETGSNGTPGSATVDSRVRAGLGDHLCETIDRLIETGEIEGKCGELLCIATSAESTPLLLVAGLGKPADVSRGSTFDAAAAVIRRLADKPRSQITFLIGETIASENHDAVVAGAVNACEGQHLYQSQPATHVPSAISFVGISQAAALAGEKLGASINLTRRLVNEPPTIMNPAEFADRAAAMAATEGLQCEIWDEQRLEAEGCRAILAVGRASTSPPRLVILRHDGGGSEPPLAIVGKGVTFDSGGLSIKPSEGMVDMKCDMAGAATVVGVMQAIARLGIRRNVIGLCGLAENMISGDAYKLGDVIETRSGKTIEIRNTDAEGRVVLADTLDVAVEQAPSAIVDLATLTGACMVALGNEVAGLMTNNPGLCEQVTTAAGQEDEPVWQLPMFSLYDEKVKSKIADIKNVGEGRWGGAITAAKFLEPFVQDTPWLHIDIAGPAFADTPKPSRDAGATGVMVRTLVRWIGNSVED